MHRFVVAAVIGCAALRAQTPATDVFDKAPPPIEEALRARAGKFFQAHVDGKFREAEAMVAEDSKETFFAMEKKRYLSWEIVRINYSENFTKASVVTALETIWRSSRLGTMKVKPPVTSLWKLENGEWCWYVVPQKDWDTPFGKMNPGPDNPNQSLQQLFRGVTPGQINDQVKISKTDIRLSSYEKSSDTVEIANSMPGDITLKLEAFTILGLEASLDRETLKPGEKARLTFNYNPATKEAKPRTTIGLQINPISRYVRFQLTFSIPPEVEKLLPKSK